MTISESHDNPRDRTRLWGRLNLGLAALGALAFGTLLVYVNLVLGPSESMGSLLLSLWWLSIGVPIAGGALILAGASELVRRLVLDRRLGEDRT